MKSRLNRGLEPNLYYFRDSHKNEVDVIYKKSHELIPIEIKSSQTFNPALLTGIQYYQSIVGAERTPKGYLVYAGEQQQQVGSINVVNFRNAHEITL
jgi:predicted AAA+ superfamily ATPase